MAAPLDRRSSTGVDRRASMPPAMSPAPDDDDGDYDLESAGVADGFRPAQVSAIHDRIPSITTTTSHPHEPAQGRRTPPPRPSSTTKPPRNSFTLRHDGTAGPGGARNPSASGALPARSSTSTDAPFVPSESPYAGPAGPSHPYQMYAQGATVTRSPSTATASTIRPPERTYEGPNGPTHPYGMYPQNTVPETDSSSTQSVPVLVGFPGLNNDYQRRLGPDGEELADIIGPDGHTEQLPPYSKYPDEAFARKARSAAPPIPAPLPGAGGIGLATRDPEFSSQEDLHAPPSRRSTRSSLSNATTRSAQSSHASEPLPAESEKPQQKRWKRIARKKLCGIVPVWSIMLVVITLILFVIILVAVLASLWHKHSANKQHHLSNNGNGGPDPSSTSVDPSMASTIDASPFISLPTNIPRLPTGTYQIPLTTASVAPQSCLSGQQQNAWSCDISPVVMPYEMKVSPIGGSNILSNNEIFLSWGNNTMNSMPYGAQPPILHRPQVLNLALDKYSIARGPAWYFETLLYDKLVVVPENELTAPSAATSPSPTAGSKRDAHRPGRNTIPGIVRRDVPQPGEKPWFCYWNSTLLEAFIYVNDTSTASCVQPTSTAAPGASTTSTTSPAKSTTPGAGTGTSFAEPSPFMPCYPKVLKIEERRISSEDGNPPPYCIQQYITGDGEAKPFLDANGNQVKITLTETEPPIPPPLARRGLAFNSLDGRDADLHERASEPSCGCAWMTQ